MMNVNFFEKKTINILPYIVGGIFILSLLLMAGYFLFTETYYENQIQEKNDWLSEHAEQVVLSREISRLDRLASDTDTVQQQLLDNRYPMDDIIIDVVTAIPDEVNRVQSFTLNSPTQISLVLDDTTTVMAQTIVEDLIERNYVTDVQFLSVQNQNTEDSGLRFEFIIDINSDNIVKEETE